MLTQCPKCKDTAIVQRERAPTVFVWVADGWRDDDGLEVEIDYCPSCGIKLLDADEFGELPIEMLCLIDQIETAFAACQHLHGTETWCNVCGAVHIGGIWCAPHWRDILVPLLIPRPLERYRTIVTEVLVRRALGPLDEDAEEAFVVALNDCRQEMSSGEEAQIEGLVDATKARLARVKLPSLKEIDDLIKRHAPATRTTK